MIFSLKRINVGMATTNKQYWGPKNESNIQIKRNLYANVENNLQSSVCLYFNKILLTFAAFRLKIVGAVGLSPHAAFC